MLSLGVTTYHSFGLRELEQLYGSATGRPVELLVLGDVFGNILLPFFVTTL